MWPSITDDLEFETELNNNMEFSYDIFNTTSLEQKTTIDEKFLECSFMKSDNYEIEEYHYKPTIIEEEKANVVNKKFPKKMFGRRRKDQSLKNKGHSKNKKDNRKNKIKTNFLNFVIEFINGLIKGGLYNIKNIKFRKISYSEKSNISISVNKELFCKQIKDILALRVSTKYCNKSEQNLINLEKLRERCKKTGRYECFEDIINISVKDFYRKFYLADNIQEILNFYQITKSIKLQFFKEFTQKLIDKGEKIEYVDKLINEAKTFVIEFMEKKPKNQFRSNCL